MFIKHRIKLVHFIKRNNDDRFRSIFALFRINPMAFFFLQLITLKKRENGRNKKTIKDVRVD